MSRAERANMPRMHRLLSLVPLALAACVPVEEPPPDGDEPVVRTAFSFEPIALDGLPTRWGSPVAPGVFLGGVNEVMTVQADVFTVTSDEDGVHADVAAVLD